MAFADQAAIGIENAKLVERIKAEAKRTENLSRYLSRPIVKKILEHGEHLPPEWPVDGTTGYDAAAVIGQWFVDPQLDDDHGDEARDTGDAERERRGRRPTLLRPDRQRVEQQ